MTENDTPKPAPRKRGRPPIADAPMTPAEHSRRYRQKRAAQTIGKPSIASDMALIDVLRRSVSSGDKEQAGRVLYFLLERYPIPRT
ncbi:hypothetical protein J3A72_000416 [Stenotrophomonas sp. PvP093]|uniref:hypothetical protein n=1 Tax=unclassified Stenotrophomonas TaxID=196198 RepID=UPI001AE21764|nr:hypothetical protein [Stenotrophomonas sp. PvP093]MBP2480124.1 hypothetical protein [Stenotrophomonas sp. PvP093]